MGTSIKNGIDNLMKSTNTNFASKSTSELYKMDNSKTTSKSEDYKSEDFKDVLSSKTNVKDTDTEKVEDVNKNTTNLDTKDTKDIKDTEVTDKIQELKEKLKELEGDSESASVDEVSDILKELLSLLANLGVNGENLKLDGEESSTNNLNSVMVKVLELLKTDSVQKGLDTDSLKFMEKILSNLSTNIPEKNTEFSKELKNGMKNLMSEISNMLEKNQNQNQGEKVLSLEDILNKKQPQENKDSSLGKESNKNLPSETTKEDKFLNSLIDDDSDSTLNKINLFASRSQNIQNQGIDNARGLTINKATLTNDLIKDVKFMSNNALKELTVKVNPGNLGEITIKLIQEDGVMKANLKANSKETTALLSQNLADIKKQLGEQNIKIADVNIDLYQEDTTFFSEQGFGRQLSEENGSRNNSNSKVAINEITAEEELMENAISSDNNVEFFA